MITHVYKQWLSQRGTAYEVKLIKLVDFVSQNGYTKRFNIGDTTYIGEIWDCINLETKKKETCIIRTEYEDTDNDIGWAFNNIKDQPRDNWINPIVDEHEDWVKYCNTTPSLTSEIQKSPNKELQRQMDLDIEKVAYLKELHKRISKELKPYVLLKLQFITSPDMSVVRKWKQVSEDIKIHLNYV